MLNWQERKGSPCKNRKKKKKEVGLGRGKAGKSSKGRVIRILKQVFTFHVQWPRARVLMATYARKSSDSSEHQERKHKGRNSEGQLGQWHV